MALIAAVASALTALIALLSAVITAGKTRAAQEGIARLTNTLAQERDAHADALQRVRDEASARRSYEYEARKRLYEECEPLLFQFVELSENALHRIYSLARSSRRGELRNWMVNSDYYISSTMYHLFAPCVIYKLIQRRLTTVDLMLDESISAHYQAAKHLAFLFTADFDLAGGLMVHPSPYSPNHPGWQLRRTTAPQEYWRQGLPVGRFDNVVESLIIAESGPNESRRLMSFGEFETRLHDRTTAVYAAFGIAKDLFLGFHPRERPILWRILIAQAHIYLAIGRFRQNRKRDAAFHIQSIPKIERTLFYWESNSINTDYLDAPFDVAEAYLEKHLSILFKKQTNQSDTG